MAAFYVYVQSDRGLFLSKKLAMVCFVCMGTDLTKVREQNHALWPLGDLSSEHAASMPATPCNLVACGGME